MPSKAVFALLLWAACGPKAAPEKPGAAPELAQLVQLEARREAGTAAAVELTKSANVTVRLRAVRALGRIGDPAARSHLQLLTGHDDAATRDAAIWALGIAGGDGAEEHLLALYPTLPTAESRAVTLEALGRVGGPDSLTILTSALQDGDPAVRAAGGLALGVFGRRAIALDDGVRRALRSSAGHADPRVAYAVAYALAREHQPGDDRQTVAALAKLARRPDAETRATALYGLTKRKGVGASTFLTALEDTSWLVRLQGVKGLTGDEFGTEEHAALAAHMAREWALVAGRPGPATHVLVEGLRALAPHAREAVVSEMADTMATRSAARLASAELRGAKLLVASMVHCLTGMLQVRRGHGIQRLFECGGKSRHGWPRHARMRLVLEAVAAQPELAEHLAVWRRLQADKDPRVRAAALELVPALVKKGHAIDADFGAVLAGLDDSEIEVSGTAADVIAKLYAPDAGVAATRLSAMAGDLLRAAGKGAGDVELELTYLSAIRDAKLDAGLPLCKAAVARANRTVRAIARECVEALGGDPGAERVEGAPSLPPVDPGKLQGKKVTWHLETTRGAVTIVLEPERAPWHVAVLVHLTGEKFYDGLMWHRVVPGFVVQGGAPGDSGWGGPGFTVPGEASPARYDAGVVGIADAGLDTGGSQIFIMHARAPHLEARYTVVGRVTTPLGIVNALQVGDRILSARATIE